MVELGRSCVHPDHRHGGVIMALWGALAGFMARNRLDTMVGCASIPMQHEGPHGMVGGGHAAGPVFSFSIRSAGSIHATRGRGELHRRL